MNKVVKGLNIVKGLIASAVLFNLVGCASYYSHYGSFSAQNSSGEERMFVLSWKTAEYPSWALQDNKSTNMVIETQCSDRTWTLVDASSANNECSSAHEGIVACGDKGADLTMRGQPLTSNNTLCLSVTDAQGANRITDLDSRLLISVSCLPVNVTREVDGEKVNIDYIKASVVPYNVATRKVERYSYADKAPIMNSKICEIDG